MVTELPDTQLAYKYVRKKILSGAYGGGHRLTSKDLPKSLGKTRAPTRGVLRQLEADGLVVLRPYVGAVVKPLDLQEYKDMCGARQALETYAAGLAAQHRNAAQIEELQRPLDAMREIVARMQEMPVTRGLLDELVREDVRFHLRIVEITQNAWLKKEIMRLSLIHRVVATSLLSAPTHTMEERRRVLKSHEEIFASIAQGDIAPAKNAMERHLQNNLHRFSRER